MQTSFWLRFDRLFYTEAMSAVPLSSLLAVRAEPVHAGPDAPVVARTSSRERLVPSLLPVIDVVRPAPEVVAREVAAPAQVRLPTVTKAPRSLLDLCLVVGMPVSQTPLATLVAAASRPSDAAETLVVGAFDGPASVAEACQALEVAPGEEVSFDIETTQLTPWSAPLAAGKAVKLGTGHTRSKYLRLLGGAWDARPRARILSFKTLTSRAFAFDLDLLSHDEQVRLVQSLHGKTWVGHNIAGFDFMWLRHIDPDVRPGFMIDTYLLNTTHCPAFEYLVRDRFATGVRGNLVATYGSKLWGGFDTTDAEVIGQIRSHIAKRRGAAARSGDLGDAGRGLPLDVFSLVLLGEKLDKSFQKPTNWMPERLSAGHHAYCLGDIAQPPIVARLLLGLQPSATTAELIEAIKRARGGAAYQAFTQAAVALTTMQRNGMHMSTGEVVDMLPDGTERVVRHSYASRYRRLARAHAHQLFKVAPELREFRPDLLAGGLPEKLKAAIVGALARLTGTAPGKTTTGYRLDAKSLKLQYSGDGRADGFLRHFWGVAQSVKRASMAEKYLAVAASSPDFRLHSLVSVATVTGRTGSQEPNLQNAPRGKDFRELFIARPGYKIIAIDYSAIEMRIAAALTVRAYRTLRHLVDLAMSNSSAYAQKVRLLKLGWVLGGVGEIRDGVVSVIDALVHLVRHGVESPGAPPHVFERPGVGADPKDWGVYYQREMYRVCVLMHAAGAFQVDPADDKLTLARAFENGVDAHLVTAIATELRAGRFDTAGATALDYCAALSHEDQELLKKKLKKPRQAAKAVNFGLLYGMAALKLHAYGITNYELAWALHEAEDARAGWFLLYPEVSLWHLLTRFTNDKMVNDGVAPVESDEEPPKPVLDKQKLYFARTLSGRRVVSDQLPAALNFQDQGSGAEIALAALAAMDEESQSYLINFVHDEFVFEVPEDRVEAVQPRIETAMQIAADRMLRDGENAWAMPGVDAKFGVPTEYEGAVGDHWIH